MDDFDFDIPELNRIGVLMRDLLPDESGPARKAAPRRAAATKGRRQAGKRLGGFALGRYADGANWKNAQGFVSPLKSTDGPAHAGKKLGGFTLSAFAAGVNWGNALDGPQLLAAAASADLPAAAPPDNMDSFWEEIKWD